MSARSVLVAMDGSPNALRALRHAIAWTKLCRMDLHLVHVLPRIKSGRLMPQALIDDYYERQRTEAFAKASRILRTAHITATLESLFGEPAPVLAAYAKKHRCMQIVIGNKGHGAVKGLLIGSVAMKVLHLSSVPVVLVK